MEASVLTTRACPRCMGAMTRVDDLGDTYQSCVQCGYVAYGNVAVAPLRTAPRAWKPRQAADRSLVRRRQIARQRARAARMERDEIVA